MADNNDTLNLLFRLSAVIDPQFSQTLKKAAQEVDKAGKNIEGSLKRTSEANLAKLTQNLGENSTLVKGLREKMRSIQKYTSDVGAQRRLVQEEEKKLLEGLDPKDKTGAGAASKRYTQAKGIFKAIGTPQEIKLQVAEVENNLKRLRKIYAELGKENPSLSKSMSNWFTQNKSKEQEWVKRQQELKGHLQQSEAAMKRYELAIANMAKFKGYDPQRIIDIKRDLKTLLTGLDLSEQGKQFAQAQAQLKKALEDRKRLIDDYLKKSGITSPTAMQQTLGKISAKMATGTDAAGAKASETALINLYTTWRTKANEVATALSIIPKEIQDAVPYVQQIKDEWEKVGKEIEDQMTLYKNANSFLQRQKVLADQIKYDRGDGYQTTGGNLNGMRRRYQTITGGISERPQGYASDSQLRGMTRLIQDAQERIMALKEAMRVAGAENDDYSDGLSDQKHEIQGIIKEYEDWAEATKELYKEQKKLNSEGRMQNTRYQARNAIANAVGGMRFGMLSRGAHGAAKLFKESYDDGGIREVGKSFAYVGGTIAAIAIPLKIFDLAMKAIVGTFRTFTNVIRNGIGTIKGFISSSVAAHQQLVAFALQTGLSINEAQKLSASFRVLGLDTTWVAVGMGALNKSVIENNAIYAKWGIATRDATGNARRMSDVLDDLNDKYQSLNEGDRINFLADLQTALPFINMITPMITTNLNDILKPLENMNVILDETEQKDMTRVVASVTGMKLAFEGLANTVTIALAPAIESFANTVITVLVAAMPKIQKIFRSAAEQIRDFFFALGGGDTGPISAFADAFSNTEKTLESGNGTMGLYTDTVQDLDKEIAANVQTMDDWREHIEDLRDPMEDMQKAMQDELEAISDAKETVSDALKIEISPLEDRLELIEKSKESWIEERDTALEAIDDEIKALQRANRQLSRDERAELNPLNDALEALKEQKKALAKAAKDAKKDVPDYSEEIDAQNAIKDGLQDQIESIRDATDAWTEQKEAIIDNYQSQIDVINNIIDGIRKQEAAASKAANAQKKLLQDQIDAIQEVGEEQTRVAQDKEYWDQRAYLTGQSLLAQLEAQQRALDNRAQRQRQQGESDTDYQLRMQQLALANDIEEEQRRLSLSALDENRLLEEANRVRENTIKLLQDQIQAIEDAFEAQKEANDTLIEGYDAQKDSYSSLIDGIKDEIDARKKADDATIKGIENNIKAIDKEIERYRDLAEEARKAQEAVDEYYDKQLEDLDTQIDSISDAIDDIKDKYDDLKEVNDLRIEDLQELAENTRDAYEAIIDPIDDEIKKIKESVDEAKKAAAEKIELLDDQAEAIRDYYTPLLRAQQDEIDKWEKAIKVMDRYNKERKRALEEAVGLQEANAAKPISGASSSYSIGGVDVGSIGTKIGQIVYEAVIAPFTKEIANPKKRVGSAGIDDPDTVTVFAFDSKAIKEALHNLIDDIVQPTVEYFWNEWWRLSGEYAPKGAKGLIGILVAELVDQMFNHLKDPNTWKDMTSGKFLPAGVFSNMGEKIGGWIIEGLIDEIGKNIGISSNTRKKWIEFFEEAISAMSSVFSPANWAIYFYKYVVKPLIDLITEWDKMIPYWEGFWEEALIAAGNVFKDIAMFLYDHLIKPIIDYIKDPSLLKDDAEKLWGSILKAGEFVFSTLTKWLSDTFVKPIVSFIDGTIKVGGELWDKFSDMWGAFYRSGEKAFSTIGTWLSDTIGKPITGFFSGLGSSIGTAFGGVWSVILKPFETAYKGIDWMFEKLSAAISKIAGVARLDVPDFSLPDWQNPSAGIGDAYAGQPPPGSSAYPEFAEGGRIDRPTRALIGEAGYPEYVISTDPSKKSRTMGLLQNFFKELNGGRQTDGGFWSSRGGPFDFIDSAFGKAGEFFSGAFAAGKKGLDVITEAPSQLMSLAKDQAAKILKAAIEEAISATPGQLPLFTGLMNWVKDAIIKWFIGSGYDAGTFFDAEDIFGNGAVIPTQSYGDTTYAQGAYADKFHHGVDIASVGGQKIPLFGSGRASLVSKGYNEGLGNYVAMRGIVKGGEAIQFLLGHLDRVLINFTDTISKATQIGNMGTTGYSDGVHTHVQTRNEAGTEINPERFFPSMSWFWGSDAVGYRNGGLVKPNSTLLDMYGRPYARAGEGGLSEAITPIDMLKNVVKYSVASGISSARMPAMNSSQNISQSGPTLHIENIYANTKEDGQEIARVIRNEFEDLLTNMKTHKRTVAVGRRI